MSGEELKNHFIDANNSKIKEYQAEIERLKAENLELQEFYNLVKSYYEDLDSLAKRLQDDYAGDISFTQQEEDRLGLCQILDRIDDINTRVEIIRELDEQLKKDMPF